MGGEDVLGSLNNGNVRTDVLNWIVVDFHIISSAIDNLLSDIRQPPSIYTLAHLTDKMS